ERRFRRDPLPRRGRRFAGERGNALEKSRPERDPLQRAVLGPRPTTWLAIRFGGRGPSQVFHKKLGRLRLGPKSGLSAELLEEHYGLVAKWSRPKSVPGRTCRPVSEH